MRGKRERGRRNSWWRRIVSARNRCSRQGCTGCAPSPRRSLRHRFCQHCAKLLLSRRCFPKGNVLNTDGEDEGENRDRGHECSQPKLGKAHCRSLTGVFFSRSRGRPTASLVLESDRTVRSLVVDSRTGNASSQCNRTTLRFVPSRSEVRRVSHALHRRRE